MVDHWNQFIFDVLLTWWTDSCCGVIIALIRSSLFLRWNKLISCCRLDLRFCASIDRLHIMWEGRTTFISIKRRLVDNETNDDQTIYSYHWINYVDSNKGFTWCFKYQQSINQNHKFYLWTTTGQLQHSPSFSFS